MATLLHYAYDPLCGWCYAAAPLLQAVSDTAPEIELRLHGGGLFAGVTPPASKRDAIRAADARIAQMTGQRFGEPYLDELLADPLLRYDSAPPIAAILAAQAIVAKAGLPMLKAIQQAHYLLGLRVVDSDTLVGVAQSIGLQEREFRPALARHLGKESQRHIESTRARMAQLGASGFPSVFLEQERRWLAVPHERFYGDAQAFVRQLR